MSKVLPTTAVHKPGLYRRIFHPGRTNASVLARSIRSIVAFTLVLFATVLLRKTDPFTGYWVLALAALGLILLPTARLLSQRILYNGLILTGAISMAWWIPPSRLGADHGTLLLGITAAALVAWISYGRRPLARTRRLLPTVRWIDLMPLLAGLFAAYSMSTFLTVRSSAGALAVMTTRWDYQSHFSIYNMLRTHGAVIPMVPLPAAGGTWGFVEYPQGFHAMLATMAEIVSPVSKGLDAELVSFFNLQAVLCGLTVVLVTAGMCSLGPVRRHALVMVPVVSVTVSAWVMGPGAIPIFEGFANFYVGCGIAAASILAILASGPKVSILAVTAIGAGIVGVSTNWILLVSLIAVMLFLTLGSVLFHRERYNQRWWLKVAVVAVVTGVGLALPISQVITLLGSAEVILAAQGGMPLPDIGWALVIIVLTLALGIVGLGLNPKTKPQLTAFSRRPSIIAVGLLFPVGICVWLAYSQVQSTGSISYYFYKYLVAVELVAWVVFAATLASLLPRVLATLPRRNRLGVASAPILITLASTQIFGFTATGFEDIGLPPAAFPVVQSQLQLESSQTVSPTIENLLSSGLLGQSYDAVYVSGGAGMNAILALRWQLGMSGNLTSKNMATEASLENITVDNPNSPQLISKILATDTNLRVLVNADLYAVVQGRLALPEQENRLLPVN